jgi:hypothetical protein
VRNVKDKNVVPQALDSEHVKRLQQKALAVCRIVVKCDDENFHHGTAFLVTKTMLITCVHVIYDARKGALRGKEATIHFVSNDDKTTCGTVDFALEASLMYPALKTLNKGNICLDLAILKIDTPDLLSITDKWPPEQFIQLCDVTGDAPFPPFTDAGAVPLECRQSLFLIHFPLQEGIDHDKRARVNSMTENSKCIIGHFNYEVFHECSTSEGSSGAPALDADGRLLLVHRAGGHKKYHGKGEVFFNVGVRVDLVFLADFGFPERVKKGAKSLRYLFPQREKQYEDKYGQLLVDLIEQTKAMLQKE